MNMFRVFRICGGFLFGVTLTKLIFSNEFGYAMILSLAIIMISLGMMGND